MINTERDAELFVSVATIAMLDGIDHRFVKSLQNIGNITFGIAPFPQTTGNVVTNAMGSASVARNDETFRQ